MPQFTRRFDHQQMLAGSYCRSNRFGSGCRQEGAIIISWSACALLQLFQNAGRRLFGGYPDQPRSDFPNCVEIQPYCINCL